MCPVQSECTNFTFHHSWRLSGVGILNFVTTVSQSRYVASKSDMDICEQRYDNTILWQNFICYDIFRLQEINIRLLITQVCNLE